MIGARTGKPLSNDSLQAGATVQSEAIGPPSAAKQDEIAAHFGHEQQILEIRSTKRARPKWWARQLDFYPTLNHMSYVEQVRSLRRAGKHEEACALAVSLAVQAPRDAELHYETACVHDSLGREARAVPFYLAAISGDLSAEHLRSAYLGLGSTYRTLGEYAMAEQTLREGLTRFHDAAELRTFLAMTLHNLGQSKHAVEMLLTLLAESSADSHVQAYRKAILFYAQDIERSWPDAT